MVLVSGHDGGTGASPLNSLKHAGTPWEIGLAETQQTLMLNGMRDRVVVQVDGQMKTGRDVVVAALLGAEEYGFATAPLVVEGCILMRVCHLDTCPVGVATQNPELRKRFTGKPEFVVNFFEFIAQEVRELLAELGFRSLDEAIGQADALDVDRAVEHWKASGLDLGPVLTGPSFDRDEPRRHVREQDHELDEHFDVQLIQQTADVLEHGGSVTLDLPIRNTERAVGTMLGHEVTLRHGENGLPAGSIDITLRGPRAVARCVPARRHHAPARRRQQRLRRQGPVRRCDRRPPGHRVGVRPAENVIAGNVIGYGATQGSMFIRGIVASDSWCATPAPPRWSRAWATTRSST